MHALTLELDAGTADAICDALSDELGALSVSVEDAAAGTPEEQPVFDEPGIAPGRWRRARVCAHFEREADAIVAATAVAAATGGRDGGVRIASIDAVDEQDWVRVTQAQFGPTAIDAGFWIVPTWAEIPPAATRTIRLDPGMAFGTGSHPTTRMCLRWIAAHGATLARPGSRALDYGCGSGVLAIAARVFGASAVDAVDIDAAAVAATRANALANGVELRIGLPDLAHGRYGLVVANILATPLKLLAPLLCGHLAAEGRLLLAGILERQADELKAAYRPFVSLAVADCDDGWILMTASARAGPCVA
ncbi:MAG: 50S ribosomal protein L11 methyltransferase [Caldimonas sp.]